jgi:two-component system OmpR family sensor kinase
LRIRRRLVLYAVGVAAIGMTVFGVLLAALASGGVARDQDLALASLASEVVAVAESTDADALAAREPLLAIDLATSTDPFIAILDGRGRVLYATGRIAGEPPRIPAAVVVDALELGSSVATIRPEAVELRVHARRWDAGGTSGIALAGQSTAFLRDQLAGLNALLIMVGLVTVIAVAIVSWLVVGRAMRPLRSLAATADEIGRTGDLERRLPAVDTRDEIGSLTASFNAMLDSLQRAHQRLSDALAAQRRFVADASHELRTPMTTIRSNAGFLSEHPEAADADRDAALVDIAAEAERMSRLVDGLLTLARADAGQPLDRRTVDVAAIVEEVASRARRPDRMVVATSDGPALVDGDHDALTRLVWILVDNALRHGAGDVRLRPAAGDWVTLTVDDDGPGLPDGAEERIFERFHRGDAARSSEGTGLGLAIARSIVEAHGGTIVAANRPEGGARFTVWLPPLPAVDADVGA